MTRHQHEWTTSGGVTAPAGPAPALTRFVVLLCACGAESVFPDEHYALTSPEFKTYFERAVRLAGRSFVRVTTRRELETKSA